MMSVRDILVRMGFDDELGRRFRTEGDERAVRAYECCPECPIYADTLAAITPHRTRCSRFREYARAVGG